VTVLGRGKDGAAGRRAGHGSARRRWWRGLGGSTVRDGRKGMR
jgi:hypothetical protein